jgi:hypothetical protein
MKEEEFNSYVKNAVEDYESKSVVHFDKQKVWNNAQVKSNKRKSFLFLAASLIVAFLSVAFWINLEKKPQNTKALISKKPIEIKKSEQHQNLAQKVNSNILPILKTSKINNSITQYNSKTEIKENNQETAAIINIIPDTIINIVEKPKTKGITEAKETFAVEFKRGKPAEIVEEKPALLSISFKKHQPAQPVKTETAIAQNEPKNYIFKIKF